MLFSVCSETESKLIQISNYKQRCNFKIASLLSYIRKTTGNAGSFFDVSEFQTRIISP